MRKVLALVRDLLFRPPLAMLAGVGMFLLIVVLAVLVSVVVFVSVLHGHNVKAAVKSVFRRLRLTDG